MTAAVEPTRPLRLAIVQPRMHWTTVQNTASALLALERAADGGAQLAVFPELALTGFHRDIVAQAAPSLVEPALRRVQQACARHRIAAVLGAPTRDDEGRLFNSAVFVDATGTLLGVVEKNGLTPAEATVCAHGSTRPVVALLGWRTSAILCREVGDVEPVIAQLAGRGVEVIFWPGLMRPAVDGSTSGPDSHFEDAERIARGLGAWIVQSNWPNSVNRPEEDIGTGRSVVIAPDGRRCLFLPAEQVGIGVFDLGSSQFDWQAEDTGTDESPTAQCVA
jgi:omega-amidase